MYYVKNKDEVRRQHRLAKYGLTDEQFQTMLVRQKNSCVICNKVFNSTRDTHVDHCHRTGKVRGILCGACNNGLGRFEDDTYRLLKAILYLKARG